jgi:hypothetical protein
VIGRRIPSFRFDRRTQITARSSCCGRIGHIVGFDFASLPGCGDHEAETFEPGQAFDDSRARELRALHEQSQADRDATVGNTAAGLDDSQVDFDRVAGDPGQVSAVEKNRFYPVVVSGFGPGDWHDLTTYFKGFTGVSVDLGPFGRAILALRAECQLFREGVLGDGSWPTLCLLAGVVLECGRSNDTGSLLARVGPNSRVDWCAKTEKSSEGC